MSNPYDSLPDHQFWRRGVSQVEPFLIDPVVGTSVKIGPADRVATAGSCFAQHISRALKRVGFQHYITEYPDREMPEPELRRRNYGVFSARYGNLYTAHQLLQLFQEAFGWRVPDEAIWERGGGRFVDAFRPLIEPDGFGSPDEVRASRRKHLTCVRRLFETADVLIFTLGLTEAWRSRSDGSVFPLAPGVAGGHYQKDRHEFVNFSVYNILQALSDFVGGLKEVNPNCRVLLTVSPVPLIATFEPRHVLTSTTYSKSVLRVAAEEVVRSFRDVEYFPSYEIITGNHSRGTYFEDDLREVKASGVAHVMRVFLRHHLQVASAHVTAEVAVAHSEQVVVRRSTSNLDEIVCDEDILDQSRARETRLCDAGAVSNDVEIG